METVIETDFSEDRIQQWEERREQRILDLEKEYGITENEAPKLPPQTCEICKQEYIPSGHGQKYCKNRKPQCDIVAARLKNTLSRIRREIA
ncbi:hypothetical protein KAR91_70350 [Candidatus Pacearchaeota archaeon]|nr:hypothetical protein [Candidatus Pacearchaeota archaeon]